MLYKRGDRVIVWVDKLTHRLLVETTILSHNVQHDGYAIDPEPLGIAGWQLTHRRRPDYPDALLGEWCWFYFSEAIVGFAPEIVVIDTMD